ncbi:MAG: hypothetical protein PHG91_13715 [Syntrophales bacterium]|nr:hypothetical protein [Syntrophales bacterium]MDD5234445.1 hypothetical protein [Syntrophales bacterium]
MLREVQEILPCVGCGYCCFERICTFGAVRHPEFKGVVCPELEWNGVRYVCKIMSPQEKLSDFYRTELQTGQGCRFYLNPWRNNVRIRKDFNDL